MPKPSLELPKIPAATIMELRSEDGLRLRLQEAADSYTHARAAQWLSTKALDTMVNSVWNAEEQRAFEIGVQVGQVVSYGFASRPDESLYEVLNCEAKIDMLEKDVPHPSNFHTYTGNVTRRMDTDSAGALSVFESISRVHVGDEKLVAFARRGSAALHNLVFQIDVLNHDDQLNRPLTRVGHLSLVP